MHLNHTDGQESHLANSDTVFSRMPGMFRRSEGHGDRQRPRLKPMERERDEDRQWERGIEREHDS